MKALVNTAAGRLEMLERPTPTPGEGEVLVRTAYCGICATDVEMIAGWARTTWGAIPGHEWSGRVERVGPGVETALAGRACVAENVLSDGGEVGFEHGGGYGEFFVTEAANVRVLPDEYSLAHAALIEPLAVCVRAMRRLALRDRTSALVLGDGPVGLLLVALLAREGVERIVVVGGRARRLDIAREMGATIALNRRDMGAGAGYVEAIRREAGEGFANVLEASGSADAITAALDVAAKEGKVLVIGDYGSARAGFPWNHLLHRELELIGSNASAGAWDEAVALAVSGEVPLGRLDVARHAGGTVRRRHRTREEQERRSRQGSLGLDVRRVTPTDEKEADWRTRTTKEAAMRYAATAILALVTCARLRRRYGRRKTRQRRSRTR